MNIIPEENQKVKPLFPKGSRCSADLTHSLSGPPVCHYGYHCCIRNQCSYYIDGQHIGKSHNLAGILTVLIAVLLYFIAFSALESYVPSGCEFMLLFEAAPIVGFFLLMLYFMSCMTAGKKPLIVKLIGWLLLIGSIAVCIKPVGNIAKDVIGGTITDSMVVEEVIEGNRMFSIAMPTTARFVNSDGDIIELKVSKNVAETLHSGEGYNIIYYPNTDRAVSTTMATIVN